MADDRAITAKQFDMMKKEFDKMKKEMEQREKKIEQRMDMLQESLATLVSSTPKQQSQMPPPSVSGSDSKRANSASGGDRKRAKTEEDDKKSINPSECSIATRKQIIGKAPDELDDMELEDWQFDQIIELKECPEKLYKRVFSVLRKYLKYGQKVKRMNEATRKHIVGAVLVEIVWFVTKQFDPTKIKMPKLNVEGSLVWAFGERKIRGRYDLSIYGKHYPIRDFFFVIEMKANQSLLLGRDQCLIYMKRTWELNENEVSNFLISLFQFSSFI